MDFLRESLHIIKLLYYLCIMEQEINIELLPEAADFYRSLNEKEQEQVTKSFDLVVAGNRKSYFFKKLTTDIWEFRAKSKGNIFRLFAFWDKERKSFIVCTHGLRKKTQKTPHREIKRAEAIMDEYYKNRVL